MVGDPFVGGDVEMGHYFARSNGSLEVDDEVEHPGALGDDDIAGDDDDDWAGEDVVEYDSVAKNNFELFNLSIKLPANFMKDLAIKRYEELVILLLGTPGE